jgi:lipopolysaccharide/colanic/teichoic acid biosynthesis glycosyltransferase
MSAGFFFETLLVLCIAAVAYHHVGYPVLLRTLARQAASRAQQVEPQTLTADISREQLPSITIIVPAFNEQEVIAQKIENLSRINYPADRLDIVIALDGCTDSTRAIAQAAVARAGADLSIRIVDHPVNRGKIAVLNEHIAAARSDIVALNDASGMIDPDALRRAVRHFLDARVGVVCPTYNHPHVGSEGEAAYWRMQTEIKVYEAALAAPMGAHGALYFFRRALWQPLPIDTINDDFVLPMRIVEAGYRAVYDPSIVATEVEPTLAEAEFRRRVRIGAGNMQQLVRLIGLANPRSPAMAFVFLSGKGMRPIVPFLMLLALVSTAVLALAGETLFQYLLALEVLGLAAAAAVVHFRPARVPRPLAWLSYLVVGHTASALGALAFLSGRWHGPWLPSAQSGATLVPADEPGPLPLSVVVGKRVFDIFASACGLVLLAVMWVPIALAIKLESRGPILFRQRRVGRSTPDATYLFELLKFRSMFEDAEKLTGPVFAGDNDPRITRVGNFLRKTRLDELPQFINVFKGEMSMIGPRPERPYFVRKLHDELPFYTDRTTGLKPGMTGLAQVSQSYAESVSDVDKKVAYDHAYALRVSTGFLSWVKTDLEIIWKTIVVVVRRTGQ